MCAIQKSLGMGMISITHDLAVARYMCDRIAVMYLGKIVELAETEELLQHPQHPYTRALLPSVPVPDPRLKRQPANIKSGVPTPIDPPAYCRFYDRCPIADNHCRITLHPPIEDKGNRHYVACYRV